MTKGMRYMAKERIVGLFLALGFAAAGCKDNNTPIRRPDGGSLPAGDAAVSGVDARIPVPVEDAPVRGPEGGVDARITVPVADAPVQGAEGGVDAKMDLPSDSMMTTFTLPATPTKALDILFVVDNSATMAPKQRKLAAQFPKFMESMKDPITGGYPSMRIAFLSTDVGSAAFDRCTPKWGDRGLFLMRGSASDNCGANLGAQWLEVNSDGKGNYTGDVGQVFQCLALGVDQSGCGFEQPINSIHYAFAVYQAGINGPSVKPFLRQGAQLVLVIVSDEDDCSMPLDSLLAQPDLISTESWSLRCATRGHVCGGANLEYPTTQSFSADYSMCAPRTDFCPAGVRGDVPTDCSPLVDYREIANVIKEAKGASAESEIFVAGIFGMPRADQATATYRIDKIPSPTEGKPPIYDYWPVCYDPARPPTGAEYDSYAVELGATGGLRIQAFLDEFPAANRFASSICEPDFGPVFSRLATRLSSRLAALCLPTWASPNYAWQVSLLLPSQAPATETVVPRCPTSATETCYVIEPSPEMCGDSGYRVRLNLASGAGALPEDATLIFRRG